jgi:DNA-binding GntR family transcriptional regulator
LREQVIDGHFERGERLNEVAIARSFGVSRGPVREALQRLASEGLVELIPRRGAFIPAFDTAELIELCEVREGIEVAAVRLAAVRTGAEGVRTLQTLLKRTEERMSNAPDAPYPTALDFHGSILELSGNSKLSTMGDEIHRQLQFARAKASFEPTRSAAAYKEHVEILDAIARRDPDEAERCMRNHLQRSLVIPGMADHQR